MLWVYDLPNWLFGILTIALFVAFGLVGHATTRTWVPSLHHESHCHNDVVSLWALVLICAATNIALTWLFHVRKARMHFWLKVQTSLLGLMIFLLAAMDHPYRRSGGI